MAVMLIGRTLQGIGGGMMLAGTFVGMNRLFPKHSLDQGRCRHFGRMGNLRPGRTLDRRGCLPPGAFGAEASGHSAPKALRWGSQFSSSSAGTACRRTQPHNRCPGCGSHCWRSPSSPSPLPARMLMPSQHRSCVLPASLPPSFCCAGTAGAGTLYSHCGRGIWGTRLVPVR